MGKTPPQFKELVGVVNIAYGRQDSGKTFFITQFLKGTGHKYKTLHVFLGTKRVGNTDYDALTPKCFIVGPGDPGVDILGMLDRIRQEQNDESIIHKNARNPEILLSIAQALNLPEMVDIAELRAYAAESIAMTPDKEKAISDKLNLSIRKILRISIENQNYVINDTRFEGKILNETQKYIAANVRFNGRICVILDDMTSFPDIKNCQFMKDCETLMRHTGCTVFWVDQSMNLGNKVRAQARHIYPKVEGWLEVHKSSTSVERNKFESLFREAKHAAGNDKFSSVITHGNRSWFILYPQTRPRFETFIGDPQIIRKLTSRLTSGDNNPLARIYDRASKAAQS